jgi:uncharacterized protein
MAPRRRGWNTVYRPTARPSKILERATTVRCLHLKRSRSSRRLPARLIIMVKEPRLGRVKTRLALEIGAVEATRFYRTVTANLIRRLAGDPRWETVLGIAPDRAEGRGIWPRWLARVPQGRGDIGERMHRLLAHSGGPSVLIGSDIPGVRAAHIAEAFRLLAGRDAVFGPAADGGFWLIGTKAGTALPGMFAGVEWSSPSTLTQTLRNFEDKRVGFAATLSDVDDAASLRRVGRLGACLTLPSSPGARSD